jgi:hypothetical protein
MVPQAPSRTGEDRRGEPLTGPAGPDNRARLMRHCAAFSALEADERTCRISCLKRPLGLSSHGTCGASISMPPGRP